MEAGQLPGFFCLEIVMPASIAKKGDTFWNLTLIRPTDKRYSNGSVIWKCKCICTNKYQGPVSHIKNGSIKSCGCLKKIAAKEVGQANIKHGESHGTKGGTGSLLYKTWERIKNRTNDFSDKSYAGRGIFMYEPWRKSYSEFKAYVLQLPNCPKRKFLQSVGGGKRSKLSFHRPNNDEGYYPGNIEWANATVQARNRKNTFWVYHPETGDVISLAELCEEYDVNYKGVWLYLKRGGKLLEALTKRKLQ